MDKVSFLDITNPITNEVTTHAIIDRGNGEFTSMPKAVYDAQVAQATLASELSNPSTPQAGE
jgi:hypothetical protein